ncbi:outer membrane beta-barrel protein [Aquisalimonas lutea]|uniref:outer membrane protein n=1 Tax=Aquisalimonas lutea TaxID=1327750 RepID=UPI0025B2D6C6|nr:outer membrane beta-barrel protein [Aquisalimonas lutea]MDN3516892.1 outer membrane beta-barrel protein [Aquisalimonas lutea]
MQKGLPGSTATLLFLLAAAGPAQAADRYEGIHVGAQGGWTSIDADYEDSTGTADGLSLSGPYAGVIIGTGLVRDRVYFGLELQAGFGDAEHRSTFAGNDVRLSAESSWGASVRLGRVIDEGTLLYATAGYQGARFDDEVTVSGTTVAEDETTSGVQLGGGIELMNRNRNFARFEYSITRYDDIEGNAGSHHYEPIAHRFTVAGGYRF